MKQENVKIRYSSAGFNQRSLCELMSAIENYNPYCSQITYSTIFAMMLANDKFKANYLTVAPAGHSKSRSTSDLQDILKIPNVVVIKGYVTPYSLFKTFVEHPNELLIFDEMERTLENPQSQFILRSALYGGKVCWRTSKSSEQNSEAEFKGCLVANLNRLPSKNDASAALLDRCFVNKLELTNLQIAEKIKHTRTYDQRDFVPACEFIKSRITEARSKGLEKLSKEEEDEIYKFVNDKIVNSTERASVRAIQKTKLIFRCVKTLFCDFDENTKRLAYSLAEPHVLQGEPDEVLNLVNSLKDEKGEFNYKLLVEGISKLKGVTERQARRIINSRREFRKKNRATLQLMSQTHTQV